MSWMERKQGIKPNDLYELKTVADPQLSPNGEELVYIETHIDKETDDYISNLFYMHLDEKKPLQWTFSQGKTSSPVWSPDGNQIAFVSSRDGQSQIYIISKHGGEARQVTFSKNGATNPVWSPCGKKLAFSTKIGQDETIHDRPDKEKKEKSMKPLIVDKMKYKSDSGGFLDVELITQIAVVDLEQNEVEQLTNKTYHCHLEAWSPDGKYISYIADVAEDTDFSFVNDIFLLELETKQSQNLTAGRGSFSQTSWSPNSRYLAYVGSEREYENATQAKLWLYDVEKETKVCLTEALDAPVGDFIVGDFLQGVVSPRVQWLNDSQSFYFQITDHGNTLIYFGNVSGEMYPALNDDEHVYGFSLNSKNDTALACISSPADPGDLYYVHLQTGKKERLTTVNKEFLATRELSCPEMMEFKGKDGWKVQGWIMKPVYFQEGKKYPTILEIHGGPHAMYGNTYFHEFQTLAGEGYVVIYVNPRGSHGYGQEFVNAVRGDYGGGDYEDLMAAIDFSLRSFEYIDQERLGVTGGSYGGFMTNWIVGHTDRFKAAVTQRSICNWISFYGVSDIGYYFTEWQILSDLEDIEKLWKHSPLKYVKHVKTPLLILHSEQDYRCPIEQGEQLFIALKKNGKETRFIRFPESNHELSRSGKTDFRIKRLEYIRDWFEKYLSPTKSPIQG